MRALVIILTTRVIAACSSPTSPVTIEMHRAQWKAKGIVNYDFTYDAGLGFINRPPGPWRIQVRGDTVRAVMRLADSSQLDPLFWPTIDRLFDIASEGAVEGRLVNVEFDPLLSYPTLIQYVPEPDRGSDYRARELQAIPSLPNYFRR